MLQHLTPYNSCLRVTMFSQYIKLEHIFNLEIPADAKLMLLHIIDQEVQGKICHISASQWAKMLRVSRKAVFRWQQLLVDSSIIEIHPCVRQGYPHPHTPQNEREKYLGIECHQGANETCTVNTFKITKEFKGKFLIP